MLNGDLLFAEILRLIACAMILLGASMVVLRFLNQPAERIRLIQISLMALLATIVVGAAGVVPKIKLPVLARAKSDAEASQQSRPETARSDLRPTRIPRISHCILLKSLRFLRTK